VRVLAKSAVSLSKQATAMLFTTMLIVLGGMTFQPFIGTLLKAQGTTVDETTIYSASAYQHVMLIIPAALLFGMLLIATLQHLHPAIPLRPFTFKPRGCIMFKHRRC
jgi:Na+-driven multidrug efflux pump